MTYSIPEMNALMEEMKIKSRLAAAVRGSTGSHSTRCERNLRIMDLSGTEENNAGVEISIGSPGLLKQELVFISPFHFLLSFHLSANRLEWPSYLCSQCVRADKL